MSLAFKNVLLIFSALSLISLSVSGSLYLIKKSSNFPQKSLSPVVANPTFAAVLVFTPIPTATPVQTPSFNLQEDSMLKLRLAEIDKQIQILKDKLNANNTLRQKLFDNLKDEDFSSNGVAVNPIPIIDSINARVIQIDSENLQLLSNINQLNSEKTQILLKQD